MIGTRIRIYRDDRLRLESRINWASQSGKNENKRGRSLENCRRRIAYRISN